MANPTLLILAAGTGSRFGGPKMLEPVGPGGETIMDYSIYDARRAGFGRIILVIRREIEQLIRERIGFQTEKHLGIEYVYQELNRLPLGYRVPTGRTKPWGTTHAILSAASAIHEPFGVINVDDFYGAESYRVLIRHLRLNTTDYATVGLVLRNTLSEFGSVARGICHVDTHGYLENILELKNIERDGGHAHDTDAAGRETRLTGDEIVSMNMWGFTPAVFAQLNIQFENFLQVHGASQEAECFIPNTVNNLIQEELAKVKVLRCPESWFGITYREDCVHAANRIRRLVEAGNYPRKLFKNE
jgi:NDP-sugar pyrophosphorylase family protein